MIRLVDLSKAFGSFYAVRGLNLHVEPGEIFGFLGPNGAGKTTTIKMMAGVLKPTGGRVVISGHDLHLEPAKAKSVMGFIPDRPFIYEKLTGMEFLRFMGALYGLDRDTIETRSRDLLEIFELEDWGDELVEAYSHGMKQKLIFSGALLHRPRVIVVDEPMVGLDPKSARRVKEIFREICDRGDTVFMSTHTLEIAEAMCHRIAIIHKGEMIALGTMEELREKAVSPQSRLEPIFLKLTGGEEMREMAKILRP